MSPHRTGMVDEDAVQLRPYPENFLRLDVDIGGVSPTPPNGRWIMIRA